MCGVPLVEVSPLLVVDVVDGVGGVGVVGVGVVGGVVGGVIGVCCVGGVISDSANGSSLYLVVHVDEVLLVTIEVVGL